MRRGGKPGSPAAASARHLAGRAGSEDTPADLGGGTFAGLPPVTDAGAGRPRRLHLLGRRQVVWTAGLLAAGALCGYALNSPAQAAGQVPQTTSNRGVPYAGTAAVGALFNVVNGKLTTHFCTASVVHSPAQNLLITAAHCVYRKAAPVPGSIAFAPGYHSGKFPHGVWAITGVYVNQAWKQRRDPNNDVAFLIAGKAGDHIERHTGAQTLGIGQPAQKVQVIGYPDSTNEPVKCVNKARTFRANPHQMVWDCGGYTTGTSGGPFLAHVNAKTGRGTVIGVIGGYEQGGDTPSVSYSPRFFSNVRKLYQQATTGKAPS